MVCVLVMVAVFKCKSLLSLSSYFKIFAAKAKPSNRYILVIVVQGVSQSTKIAYKLTTSS